MALPGDKAGGREKTGRKVDVGQQAVFCFCFYFFFKEAGSVNRNSLLLHSYAKLRSEGYLLPQ